MLLLNTPLAELQGNPFYAYAGERSAPSFLSKNDAGFQCIPNPSLQTNTSCSLKPTLRSTPPAARRSNRRSCLVVCNQRAVQLFAHNSRASTRRGPCITWHAVLCEGIRFAADAAVRTRRERATEEQFRPSWPTNLVGEPGEERGTGAAKETSGGGSSGCLRSCAIGDVLAAYSVLALCEDPDSQARHFVRQGRAQ